VKFLPSLSLKITLLALLTVLMLSGVLLVFAGVQFRIPISPVSFIVEPAINRVLSVAGDLSEALAETSVQGRTEVLERFSREYGVEFYLIDTSGQSLTERPVRLPPEFLQELTQRFREPPRLPRGPLRRPVIFGATGRRPSRYWMGFPTRIRSVEDPKPVTAVLVVVSDSFLGNQLFFDPKPWLALTVALTIVFALIWVPFIRNLTRAVREMTQATGRIAEGQFDTRLDVRRADEVGQLASAINRMTVQLSGFVKGQKRFLADIAHELCAPIARMQVALGILEQRADERTRDYVIDVKDDAQHMSALIDELLSFSKAGIQAAETELVPVKVAETVQRVVEREATSDARIEASVLKDVAVLANPECLFRALSNLVRNAIRYAGHAGPISVSARNEGRETVITVADRGPGIPDGALDDVFAPFFRLDRSRGRDSGGTGLGLAIVKACVEACKGSVRAHNRQPSGLEVEIRLRTAA